MKKLILFLCCLGLSFFSFKGLVFAQTPDQIQRSQQQLIDAQFQKQEVERAVENKPQVLSPTTKPTKKPKGKEHCVNIKKIEFSGNTKLSDDEIVELATPLINKCLTIDDINQILNIITNKYIDKGYITSGAYMINPQTKLKQGILQIKIVEGTISKFEGIENSELYSAFPFMLGEVLNLRDIEQGMDQINRLGSNKATMDIKASKSENGTSDIIINNTPLSRSSYNIYTDNLGSASTGEPRIGLGWTEDNLFGINDQLSLGYTNSIVDDYGDKNSRSATLGLNIPFGYWTLTNNMSYSYYKTSMELPISGEKFYSFGDSFTNSLSLEKLLSRGQTYKISASIGLSYKNSENYTKVLDIETKNDASSKALAVMEYGLPSTFYFSNGIVFLKPSIINGTSLLGAFKDDGDNPQQAQFDAYKIYSYSNFNFGNFSLSTTFDGQYSADELYSSEAVYIGGETTIRGFKDEGVQGDSGFYLRNDLNFNLPGLFKSEAVWMSWLSPSIFFDYGVVKKNSTGEEISLAGTGVKLSFDYNGLTASITGAFPVIKENYMTEDFNAYLYLGYGARF